MRISLDGRSVGYDDTGGPGIPLVLLHGFGADRAAWDAIATVLRGRRVIRPDFRGSGESAPGDGPALMEVLAGDLAALLDALHVERAVIVGHSLGGYVAWAFFRMYAERVAGLAFVASHARSDTPEGAANRESLAQATERDGTMDAAVAAYAPRLVAPHIYEQRPELVEAVVAMMARQNPRGAVQLLRGMKVRLNSEDLFGDVAVPTLVIAGAEDAIVPLEAARRIADEVADGTLLVLDDVGHSIPLEAPERTAAALTEFAARIE